MADNDQTTPKSTVFDFEAYPPDTLFHDRRTVVPPAEEVPAPPPGPKAPRPPKKERRRRIDPTTFEKQYTADELEFMSAMQDFKSRSGKQFPSYGEVLTIARQLGYQRPTSPDDRQQAVELT